MLEGEGILTKVIIFANSIQKSAIPLNRIDINVSSAIAKVIKEYRISKVILSWNKIKKRHHRIFSRVIDQFIKKSSETTYITRIMHPVGITKNIFLMVPPLINRQSGFIGEFYSIIKMVLSINSNLIIISDEPTKEELENLVVKKSTTLNYKFMTIKSWKDIDDILIGIVKNNDMIIQIMARQGQLGWRLTFDRLPAKLVEQFSNNNIIAVYPSCNLCVDEECLYENLLGESSLIRRIPEGNFMFNFQDRNPERVFKVIADNFFNGNKEIYDDLMNVLKKSPVELTRETLLIHTYTNLIDDYLVYIATNREKFNVGNINSIPKIIIVLLSPKSDLMNRQLKILSEIAKIVIDKKLLSNILSSNNYLEFSEKLSERK